MTRRHRVFCASLSDWLDDEVPIEWLADLLKLIHDTPNLDWLLLTKRPQNWKDRISKVIVHWGIHGGGDAADAVCAWCFDAVPLPNVSIGTSVEDQPRADERIPEILKIPAKVRFLSVEPMLGPIRFDKLKDDELGANWNALTMGIHWAIFGGESGQHARPCNIDWIRDGVRQCRAAGVAPFVKQLGAVPISGELEHRLILRDKKGGDMTAWPADVQVREFPKT